MNEKLQAELAPTGILRAGINLSNFLLVTGKSASGEPEGVSPDQLGVRVEYVVYDTPAQLADAAVEDVWDIGNLGAEPERAKTIKFTSAYAEIEATYLVPAGSTIHSIDEVDREGVRIAVYGRGAYGLWLSDFLDQAELIKADGLDESYDIFVEHGLDALAD